MNESFRKTRTDPGGVRRLGDEIRRVGRWRRRLPARRALLPARARGVSRRSALSAAVLGRAALYAASQSGHEPLYEPLHKVVTRRGGAGRCLLEARADPLAPFLVRGLLPSTSLTSQQNRAESQLNCPKRQTDPLQREQTCNKSPPSLPRRAESQLSKVN